MPDYRAPSVKISIDGPAGAGKSSVSKAVAQKMGLTYLDTGAMYRAVALKMARTATTLDDPEQVQAVLGETRLDVQKDQRIYIDGKEVTEDIRKPYVNALVSQVAAIPAVRRKLVGMQQEIVRRTRGIIMDGRDIGSRVMPDADYKFYLDAGLEERARRRRKEQLAKGIELSLDDVKAEIITRDRIDSQRSDSPLVIPHDAVIIDTTGMSFEEVVDNIMKITGKCRECRKGEG